MALLLAALLSLTLQRTRFREPERAASWQRAAASTLQQLAPGERVLIHPHWDRSALPYFSPNSAPLLHLERPLIEDLNHTSAVWILAPSTQTEAALARLPFAARADSSETFGQVTLLHVPVPAGAHASYELAQHMQSARVEKVRGEDRLVCSSYDARKTQWSCPGKKAPRHVGASERELLDGPRTCIEGVAPERGGALHFTFPAVPLGQTLHLRAGWTLISLRKKRHRPSTIAWKVLVGDELMDSRTFSFDEDWRVIDLDTRKLSGQARDVHIQISSPSPKDTMLCFNGWVRP